jgi:hypothetical protein
MVERPRRGGASGALAAAVVILLAVNVAAFTWLYASVMLALEFTIIVFLILAASITRSACCDGRAIE